MKTDSIFYKLFQTAPGIFFELLGQLPAAGDGYEFKSVEVKQTSFRIDGVFLPTAEAPSQTVYFVEVQFQKDQTLYQRLFGEIFLYLQQHVTEDWQAVVIYPQRNLEPDETRQYRSLLEGSQVQRVYLDELGKTASQSLGIGLVQLVVEDEETAAHRARQLIEQAKQETAVGLSRQAIIELIETIVVYKFPSLGRQEIEEMLGLSELKQTKVYQEAFAEGEQRGEQRGEQKVQLRAVPKLLELGLTVEQVAQALALDVEAVKRIAENQ